MTADLVDLTVRELRRMAAQREIPGRSEMNREGLVRALSTSTLQERVERLEQRVEALEDRMADEKKRDEEQVDEGLVGGTREEKQDPMEDHGSSDPDVPDESTPTGDGPSGGGENPTPEHT